VIDFICSFHHLIIASLVCSIRLFILALHDNNCEYIDDMKINGNGIELWL